MKKIILLTVIITVGVLLLLILVGYLLGKAAPLQKLSSQQPTPTSSSSTPASIVSQSTKRDLLELPIDPKNYNPHAFGLYPFGAKSSEHPEGHAGINFEVKPNAPVTAVINSKILSIKPPPGRADEFNVIADQGSFRIEILRLGKLAPGISVNSELRTGEVIGYAGYNSAQAVYQFHLGITDESGNALCPSQKYWTQPAWNELQVMLQSSLNHDLCVSDQVIPYAKRNLE